MLGMRTSSRMTAKSRSRRQESAWPPEVAETTSWPRSPRSPSMTWRFPCWSSTTRMAAFSAFEGTGSAPPAGLSEGGPCPGRPPLVVRGSFIAASSWDPPGRVSRSLRHLLVESRAADHRPVGLRVSGSARRLLRSEQEEAEPDEASVHQPQAALPQRGAESGQGAPGEDQVEFVERRIRGEVMGPEDDPIPELREQAGAGALGPDVLGEPPPPPRGRVAPGRTPQERRADA